MARVKACGIIVEYNPFHNGHRYHAQQARQQSGAEVVIAIMSGNFLQRGEPALLDKWARAEEALQNGVDLVIELPTAWSVQPADYFAKGGIKLLQALQCESLCFGTDSTSAIDYAAFGQFVQENQSLIDQTFHALTDKQLSYPQKMTAVFRQVYPESRFDFSSPNHILGMSYAKENATYPTPMTLYPIARKQAGFHDATISGKVASATAIRQSVFQQEITQVLPTVPSITAQHLQTQAMISWENYWPFLKYKIVQSSLEELQAIYQMTEGLEYRLKDQIQAAGSFHELMERMKTKRYTWTRLQRLATYILLNMTKEEVETVWQDSYLHVLGFTPKGQAYLKETKAQIQLPVISKVSKENRAMLSLDIRANQLYQMGDSSLKEQNFGRFPLRFSPDT
ncbi:nucleotidyltransferase [Enterococcus faecalis]|uniref:nucleotidyltransferase n=1 Tax=Enterococcus faecalis TaxID=1351 RepID=UPI001386E36C|nr:nucleotidyltransferase [Enterococcus faecalis]